MSKLRDAYNLLEREGLIRNDMDKSKHPKNFNNRYHHTYNNVNRNNSQNNNENQHSAHNPSRNSNQFGNSNLSSQTRRSNVENFGHSHSGQFGNCNNGNLKPNYNARYYQNHNVPMDVEHFQQVDENVSNQEQVNFHTLAQPRHFQ